MLLQVDQARCCGSGMCALRAPAIFDQSDEDGTVILLQPQVRENDENLAQECAQNCPSGAISIILDAILAKRSCLGKFEVFTEEATECAHKLRL
jgi:ferredoxin